MATKSVDIKVSFNKAQPHNVCYIIASLYKQSNKLASTRTNTHNGRDDNRTKSRELSPPSLVCHIDPGNGDNGCFSHLWQDQTVKGNPLLLQFMLLSA